MKIDDRAKLMRQLKNNKEERERREAAARAAAERAKAEESEEDGQQGQEHAAATAAAAADAAAALEASMEPEPAIYDAGIFTPQPPAASVENQDFSSLQLPGGADPAEQARAYQQLLAERAVLHCAGRGGAQGALRLLFHTTTAPGLGSLAAQASQELAWYYASLRPEEAPAWTPAFQEFYDALCCLGYRGCGESQGNGSSTVHAGPTAQGGSAYKPMDVDKGAGLQPSPAAATAATVMTPAQRQGSPLGGAGAVPDEMDCLVSLRSSLILLADMCATHGARQGGLFDCVSKPAQEATVRLVLAMAELQLSPLVASCALLELDACLGALLAAWGPSGGTGTLHAGSGSSSSSAARGGRQQAAATQHEAGSEGAWAEVAMQVAVRTSQLGPSHRARADAIRQLPGCSARKLRLQQLMAVQLMADVAAAWKAQQPLEVLCKQTDLYHIPLQILKSLSPSPSKLCAAVQLPDSKKTDFHALLTLFDCAHLIFGPLIFQNEHIEDRFMVAAKTMLEYISLLSNGLNKTRDEVAVKLCALLSRMHNALEFGMGVSAHD